MCAAIANLLLKKSNDRRQIEALEKAFKEADRDKDGFLNVEEYREIAKKEGIDLTLEEAQHLVAIIDKDKDGLISKEEFIANACGPPSRPGSRRGSLKNGGDYGEKDKAELAFHLFDSNKDGYVSKQEFKNMSRNLTKEQVDAVFDKNDGDGDGKMTKEEFQTFMEKGRQHKQNQLQQNQT